MKLTKQLALFLCLALALAPTIQAAAGSPAPQYTPGTYQGVATGRNGQVTVEVVVSENAITDIKSVESKETHTVGNVAFHLVRDQVLTNQTLSVDTLAGATISRAAFLNAISNALKEAGADLDQLKAAKAESDVTPGELSWETDVLVVGSGAAGMGAAIQAAQNGERVIMLEKRGVVGGTSALSAGWFSAAGTQIQKDSGIEDSTDKYYEDWMALAAQCDDDNIDPEIIRYIADIAPKNIEWMQELGVAFTGTVANANPYDPHRLVPRVHHTTGGTGYAMESLHKALLEAGVELHTETPAVSLIQEDGKIVGAKAKDKAGNDITIKAKAVVLACGSFTANRELMAKYYPKFTDYVNSNVSDGDGLIMAEAVGAEIVEKYSLQSYEDSALSHGYFTPGALFLTPKGERYTDEAGYFYTRTRRLFEEHGTYDSNLILSNELRDAQAERLEALYPSGRALKSDSLEEVANKLGMDFVTLEATISRYNALCDQGVDEDFGKPAEHLQRIDPPYVGLDLYGNINDAYTGLRINVNAQVFANDGSIIPGLYACGGVAAAAVFPQEYLASGSALTQGLSMGRAAANHISSLE